MNEPKLTVVEHLTELRRRLVRALLATLIGTIVAYYLYDPFIFRLLKAPLDALSGGNDNPFASGLSVSLLKTVTGAGSTAPVKLFAGLTAGFMMRLKASIIAGIIMAAPFILYQIWAFVAAGLTPQERRGVRLFLPISLVLFLAGVAVAYFVMLPPVMHFFLVVSNEGLESIPTVSEYLSLLIGCCLGFGVVFQMPIFILFLTHIGLVTPKTLSRQRRYAILLIFIAAAVLTPTPDVVSQFIMAIPMLGLYEVSIWISRVAYARRRERLLGKDRHTQQGAVSPAIDDTLEKD